MRTVVRASRRTILAAIASIAPASFLLALRAWSKDEVSLDWPGDYVPPTGTLRVMVRVPEGHKPPSSIEVEVRILEEWKDLPRGKSGLVYEGAFKTGQSYAIRVAADKYMTIERTVYVNSSLVVAQVFLVPEGWPYYLTGGIAIPFKPRPRLAAVGLGRSISHDEIATLTASAEKGGFKRVTTDPDTGKDLDDVNRSVLYFEPQKPDVLIFSFDKADAKQPQGRAQAGKSRVSPDAVRELRRLFAKQQGRVGVPARLSSGRVRIVDSQYLIKFGKPVSDSELQRYVMSFGAKVLRATDGGFWLIEFADPQNIGRHLDIVAQQVKSGVLISGEPNLLVQFQAHGESGRSMDSTFTGRVRRLACQMAPDKDPYEECQGFLSRQRVDAAWCYIEQYIPGSRYGSRDIRVATRDVGPRTLDSSTKSSGHPDVDPNRMGYCYNVEAEGGAPCSGSSPPLVERDPHGMASYGLISAKADNKHGITGIAPNATHVAVEAVSIITTPLLYSETLRWVGGLRSTPPCTRFDTRNPPPELKAADIISCSHGLGGDFAQDVVKDALADLACRGRGGRGCVVVYAAGNENRGMSTPDELATNPHVIGVANTEVIGNTEVRQKSANLGSNFSPWIHLCANGQWAPSLLADPTGTGPACNGVSAQKAVGVFLHGGTSAAASMVSGAVALILTINPNLSSKQVRTILCKTAEKIDCGNSDTEVDPLDPALQWTGGWTSPANASLTVPTTCTSLPRGLDWFSNWYGYGRLDVYEAVKLAHAVDVLDPPCVGASQPEEPCPP